MTRRIRHLVMLVALVALMTLGGASAAFGHKGRSAGAHCQNSAAIGGGPNYNPATATGNPHNSVPDHAWDNPQNAWSRCLNPHPG